MVFACGGNKRLSHPFMKGVTCDKCFSPPPIKGGTMFSQVFSSQNKAHTLHGDLTSLNTYLQSIHSFIHPN